MSRVRAMTSRTASLSMSCGMRTCTVYEASPNSRMDVDPRPPVDAARWSLNVFIDTEYGSETSNNCCPGSAFTVMAAMMIDELGRIRFCPPSNNSV